MSAPGTDRTWFDARAYALLDQTILLLGAMIERRIRKADRRFYFWGESGRDRRISLGAAGWELHKRGIHPGQADFWRRLQAEYTTAVAAPQSIDSQIHRRQYERLRYFRQREQQYREDNAELAGGLKTWVKDLRAELAAEETPSADEVFEALHDNSAEEWLARLTPAERQAMERELNGERTIGAADRQARSRAKRKLYKAMSQNDRVSTLICEEESRMSTAVPTAVERIAWLEERVREHDRQLGLVTDEDAEEAIELFLRDAESTTND